MSASVELSTSEVAAHAADEEIIAAGLATFVEVGRALIRIRERRSYLLTHSSFGAYIRDRWRFNAPYAYNLIAGAEVYDVLEGSAVEVMPANARVAYELRTLIEEPATLVKTWEAALAEFGDRPLGREVARLMRNEAAPAKPEPKSEPEEARLPIPPESTQDQLGFARAVGEALAKLESAKSLQRSALKDIDPRYARTWARRVKQLRTIAADLQRAIDRKV